MKTLDLEALHLEEGAHDEDAGMCVMERKLRDHTVACETTCHLWTGYTQPNGYGYVNAAGRSIAAHRLALALTGIAVPKGKDVCHRCDVRNCVNPDHLYVGTRKENMADCSDRGRHNKPLGEAHWRAKLSRSDVENIRNLRAKGTKVVTIAKAFGVTHPTISRICRRVWRKEVA